jgi:thioesterase domain-containing protein/acyl carrier protein
VIVASNALHVAADVAVTLRHLRACLAPGGVLVALEQTRFFPWFDLGMGLQAGFDSRTDLSLRPLHPLLTRNTWARMLADAGFTATAAPVVPGSLEDLMGFDVILALGDSPAATDGALADTLRDHLLASLPAWMVPSSIDLIDRVPLSPNGKLDRRALVPAASTRPAHHPSPAADRLLRQVTEVVAEVMQQDRIDPDRSLFELGASSLTLVSLQRLLGERIGRTLPLQRIFEAPTAASFAAAIASGEAATTALVSFSTRRNADDRPKLLMMPGMFALPFYLRDMAAAVAEHLDVVSVQLPGLAAGETPIDTIEDQASYVIDRMGAAGLAPPYLIGGHSFGGHVAIAVARQLRSAGQAVPLLLLGDTVRTYGDFAQLQTDELAFTAMTRGLAALYGGQVHPVPGGLTAEEAFRHTAARMQQAGLFGALELPLDRMAAVFKANFRAIGTARPGPIPGDLAVIRTAGGFPPEFLQFETGDALDDPALGWSELVQGHISTRTIQGDHLAMLEAANLPALAATMIDLTREALASHLSAPIGQAADPAASVSGLWRALQRRRGDA